MAICFTCNSLFALPFFGCGRVDTGIPVPVPGWCMPFLCSTDDDIHCDMQIHRFGRPFIHVNEVESGRVEAVAVVLVGANKMTERDI